MVYIQYIRNSWCLRKHYPLIRTLHFLIVQNARREWSYHLLLNIVFLSSWARNIVKLAKDPMAILAKSTVTLKAILHLREIVKNVLSSTDRNKIYEKECRKIMVDPTFTTSNCWQKIVTADNWWFKLKGCDL